jgi:hypothetical protein
MATVNRWVWNFVTPSYGFGLYAGFAVSDFIIDIPMGKISDRGRRGVDRHSTVLASVCELAAAPGHPFDFPFIGSASMEVRNIAPRDDGIVSLWIHIDWPRPLHIRLNLLISND